MLEYAFMILFCFCFPFLVALFVNGLVNEKSGWNDLKFVSRSLLDRGYSSERIYRILSLYILEN